MASLTFVTPHLRHTSGGVYAIRSLAEQLARNGLDVTLLVEGGEPEPLRQVRVVTAPEDLVASDAVILYADAPDDAARRSLLTQLGPVVLYLQGFGTPGNPAVLSNLSWSGRAVCSARWLVDEARSQGAAAEHSPYGLDRSIFHPGPRAGKRRPVVSMLTHRLDWKGTDDGVAALERVLDRRSDVEVVTFGIQPPELGQAEHLSSPDRREVARLLRRSAVFVCPSWEEGFGIPGIEALACGAALATTDTKGSRDYAFHERTALVSAPRDVPTLAQNIARLLDDAGLRETLAARGQQYVLETFPPWADAALMFADAVSRVLSTGDR